MSLLPRIFIALCELPGLKKTLWRAWYDYLARLQPAVEWTFMNYGYAPPGADTLMLEQEDEPDRYWIQLYEHVAGAVDVKDSVVLEVGSGRGGGSSFVKRYLCPARMMGVDVSKNAVKFCRTRHQVNGLEFEVGDAEKLPFSDNSFDAVINVESSHCYPSFENFLSEVRRVLRPGGHFLYADFRDRRNLEAWRNMLRKCDLAVLQETDITASVVAALDRNDERKVDLIHRIIPRLLWPSFFDFAAVRGSTLFEQFRTGQFVYMSFVLRKA